MRKFLIPVLPLLLPLAAHAAAQCSNDAILDPQGPGANGQTRLRNFLTLVDDLYSNPNVTKRLFFNGNWLQVPPWYQVSDRCSEADLHAYAEFTSPTFIRYLVNGDELSELAVVTALADSEQRMTEIHHTVQAMIAGSSHSGLPCWLAKVENGVFSCLRTDTASDATARFGLAYAFAAQNPNFSPAQQITFRNAAADLARRHLEAEYAHFDQYETCPALAPTGRRICDWAGGGGDTASRSSFDAGQTHMWIGYFQDLARFLIAIAESEAERDPALANRALAVADQAVEQWLGASRFDGSRATFGDLEFTWSTVPPIQPQTLVAWDYDDAPRALWMGDVLRAIHLHTRGAPFSGAYARLSTWVQLLLAGDTQKADCSVVKYSRDGQALQSCNGGYYENGLGAGLFTFYSTNQLGAKLNAALSHYSWAYKTWDDPSSCFGIHRPIRPLKALAAAIGLDTAAYGCAAEPPPPSQHRLTVLPSGTGAGIVTSSPAGVACGTDCSESYPAGTPVTLTASPAAGSAFKGWGGNCVGTGACNVTMDGDRSVTATFALTCPAAPTALQVSAVAQTQIDLLWQDNSTNESGFKVERKEGGLWTLLSPAPANATTYRSTGLKCGIPYAYRVWAFNAECESAKTKETAASTAACPAPVAPTGLQASAVSPTRINLVWKDNSTNEAGFKIERKKGRRGRWTLLATASANTTTYQDTGVKCGTTYAYRVWAFNVAGESAKTNEAQSTTKRCP